MNEPNGNGIAGKVAGAGVILTSAATAAGLVSGREWAALAERAGMPFMFAFGAAYLLVVAARFLGPLAREFVQSIQEGNRKQAETNAELVKVQGQQAEALDRLTSGQEHLHECFEEMKTEQRETNRLLRAAAETPYPPIRDRFSSPPTCAGGPTPED